MANPKMGMNQSMRLGQELRMTPQLQQAIKLLQMSRMEFENAIMKELEENPVLEELQEPPEDSQVQGSEIEVTPDTPDQVAEVADAQNPQKQDELDWESYIDVPNKAPREMIGNSDEIMNYENMISSSESLFDHLIWQMNLAGFNEEEQKVAGLLISYIDEDGYIKTPFEDIAKDENLTVQDLEEILPFVQEFDPPGVGARNLQECLLLQAKALGEDTNDLVALIQHHLKDLERKNYEGIAKALNREIPDVIEICKIVLEMDPKPGRIYTPNDTQYVMPDVYVYKVGEEYVVALNEDGLPRLRVSNFYRNALMSGSEEKGGDKGTKDYIKDKLKSALFLIKSIHQRQRTIYRVTESIVKHQKEFLDKGPGHLRPMILRDIANDLGIHESTVSRVTSNKYVHTPRGIFELKDFFNSGISTTSGDFMASDSVKLKIKEMIVKESPKDPLSDQKIVDVLKAEGIEIARRTVAKYRDELGLLPSSKRKKYF